MNLYFTKIKELDGTIRLVIYEERQFERPILILKAYQINSLIKEWKKR